MNDIPLISWLWFVYVYIWEQAKGEYDNSQVNPTEKQHENNKSCDFFDFPDMGFKIGSSTCHKNVTGIVDYEYHDPSSYFIAHHRKKYQGGSHKMMKHPFIIFSIVLFEDY